MTGVLKPTVYGEFVDLLTLTVNVLIPWIQRYHFVLDCTAKALLQVSPGHLNANNNQQNILFMETDTHTWHQYVNSCEYPTHLALGTTSVKFGIGAFCFCDWTFSELSDMDVDAERCRGASIPW